MEVTRFERFVGIDFSAARDAGEHIWITVASAQRHRLRILAVHAASELFGCDREQVIGGLRALLARSEASLIACDACFGLPAPLVSDPWEEWVASYPERFASAEALRLAGRAADGREIRRLTDRLAAAPFAPTNLRLYRQTDLWLRSVLGPLVRTRRVTVAPFQALAPPKPHLIEVCPAVSLRHWHLPARGYKGNATRHREMRARIVDALRTFGVDCAQAFRERILAQAAGDALDSLIAATTAWAVAHEGLSLPSLPPEAHREGWIYRADPPRFRAISR